MRIYAPRPPTTLTTPRTTRTNSTSAKTTSPFSTTSTRSSTPSYYSSSTTPSTTPIQKAASKPTIQETPKKIAMDFPTFIPTALSHPACHIINNKVPVHDSIDTIQREGVDITVRACLEVESTIRPSTDTRLEFKKTSFDSDLDLDISLEKELPKSEFVNSKQFSVSFADGERENPKASQSPMQRTALEPDPDFHWLQNWPHWYKWYLTVFSGILSFVVTFAATVPFGFTKDIRMRFDLGQELFVVSVSLFILGSCFGPLIWGPLSEMYGRRPILISSFIGFTAFQIAGSVAPNFGAMAAFRLLAGTFAAASHCIAPAVVADVWDPVAREKALIITALSPFLGAMIGPLIAGYMAAAGAAWEWSFWMSALMSGTCSLILIMTLEETCAPIILARKAVRLREETRDPRFKAPLELVQKSTMCGRLRETLVKPFIIFVREPILVAIALYLAFIAGCQSILFDTYRVVYEKGYGFSCSLAFLPVIAGHLFAAGLYLFVIQPEYERKAKVYAPSPVPPERRLTMAVWSAPFFSVTFFWFGWTSFPDINYWAPLMSGFLMGITLLLLQVSLVNYVIDVYSFAAASALSSCLVLPSIFGTLFPILAPQMFHALDPRWVATIVGCIAVVGILIPFALKRYGPALRAKSRYTEPVRII
ncbi:MFS general substrate transporter [Ganoderma sinense ZZ0214-1]|uniref:MFS general substrate transporter n=1 Tax=Ganoderma sinense ZZ0214-1 TaxID=1077348 RepID=A0A2G8S259_9APHY|nr:MFS general substrate transporter [Ganoderma sinense ZZ0214-1]